MTLERHSPAGTRAGAEVPTVGVEELDRQHRVLQQRWRVLEDARLRGDRRAVRANLWFLERYAAEHFTAEERLMEDAGYPGLHQHRHEHERFGERVRRLRLEVDIGRDAGRSPHLEWIAEWFLKHVRTEDAPLGQFLNERSGREG